MPYGAVIAPEGTTALARLPLDQPVEPGNHIDDLVQIALDVAGTLQPREVIARILERTIRTVHADRATLSSVVNDAIIVEATAGRAGSVTWIGQRYSTSYFESQPIVKQAMDTLKPTFGGRLAIETAAPEFRDALADVKQVAVLPLVHAGRASGLLVLSRYEDRPFGAAEIPTLRLVGAISGLALRNARLYEEVEVARRRADETATRLRVAVEAAEQVASETKLDAVLVKLLEGSTAAVEADGASLARLEGQDMVLEATITGEGIGTRWPLAPNVRAGIRGGMPVELTASEYTATPAGLESMVQPYARFLVAPLNVGGETIGLLAMARREDRPFDPAAVQSLQQFSALGALLLRNARLIARAQEAEQAKSEFMSFAVHELRGPLTVTGGYISMALEGSFGELPSAVRDSLQIALRKTEEARQLADQLQTVARMEDRALQPELAPFSLTAELTDAVRRARPRAELLHGRIDLETPEGLTGVGDRALVGKILDNLLNNALTYVEGAPLVQVQARRNEDDVEVIVSDNGIGITQEDRARVFRRFSRGTDQRVLAKAGTGLGLYVSRGLAEQMGGSLTLEQSEPGKSTIFALRLPAG